MKDDVSEVRDGVECGIDLAGWKDMRAGDIIETFTTEQLEASLGQNSAEAKKAQLAELAAAKDAENEVARAGAAT
jgi:translation initiation factor IF-2